MLAFLPFGALTLALGLVASIAAKKSKPLGGFPYRWGAFIGVATGLISVFLLVAAALSFIRHPTARLETAVGLVWVACGLFGATGLLRRRRSGVWFSLAFYLQLVLWPAVFNALHGIPPEQRASMLLPVIILVVTNSIYFRRRWQLLD